MVRLKRIQLPLVTFRRLCRIQKEFCSHFRSLYQVVKGVMQVCASFAESDEVFS